MINIESFISSLEGTLGSFTTVWFMCFIIKYLFLKYYTKEQKRKIQILFYASAASIIINVILDLIHMIPITWTMHCICSVLRILATLPIIFPVAYICIAGRKKAKWRGILFIIPLMGFEQMLEFIYYPIRTCLPLPSLYKSLILIVVEIFILLLMFYLGNEKIRPKAINNFEDDIKNMNYSAKEAIGIWLIGIFLVIYDIFGPSGFLNGIRIFRDMTPGLKIFDDILVFILGIALTFFIINASYRRYYYEKNLKYQKTLITTMANLVESRDDNTGGHIHRTAKYVEIIARKLQSENKFKDILTDKYIDDMVIAAPLHDVGKIHISDVVLNKPGRLDDEEFAQMKSHSAAGGEIIGQVEKEVDEDISYLTIAKDMAEYHHERMDGKGYPHGIKGEEIPLCARILAVADVFDALASKRCYKAAMPLDKAYAIIKEETGDHFDVDVAQAFLDSKDEVEQFLNDISEAEETGNAAEAN